MNKIVLAIVVASMGSAVISSCGGEDTWDTYEAWRKTNNEWYTTQMARKNPDGSNYYSLVQPEWYPQSGVLIHYFNDREQTKDNLQPLVTSTVTVRYKGRLYDDSCFDSTTVGADSVRTFTLGNTIAGWQIAMTQMHVGDSCEIIIPYAQGYGYIGSTSSGGSYTVPPYSVLRFNIGLKDIPAYEIP